MEFEALLLGLEPVTALAVGVSAVVLAPVVKSVGSLLNKDSNLGETLSESAKEIAKNSMVWGFEAFESAQATFSEAEESFRDLLADAKTEHMVKKTKSHSSEEPQEVEIVNE